MVTAMLANTSKNPVERSFILLFVWEGGYGKGIIWICALGLGKVVRI